MLHRRRNDGQSVTPGDTFIQSIRYILCIDMVDDTNAPPRASADPDALRALLSIARLGTVAAAAAALGRTQPSISARLAGLERAWGTRLFYRRARGMEPTPEGRRLLPLATAALEALAAVERAAGRPVAPPAEVRIGAGAALGRTVVPGALRALLARHPGTSIRVLEGGSARLLEAVRSGEIDVAFVTRVAGSALPDGLEATPIGRSPVDLLVPASADGPRRRRQRSRELAGRPLVLLHAGSAFRRHVEAALAAAGAPARPTVEVGSFSLVRRYVAAGLGVAPVPAVAFGSGALPDVRRVRLVDVPEVIYERVVRAGTPLPEIARDLLPRI